MRKLTGSLGLACLVACCTQALAYFQPPGVFLAAGVAFLVVVLPVGVDLVVQAVVVPPAWAAVISTPP